MIEIIVRDYLAQQLEIAAYMEFPNDPPDRFIVLCKVDSGRENRVDSAMFRVRSYAETLLESAKLNEQVKVCMDNLISLDDVTSSRLNGDYPYNDTANKRHCYQAVYDITHY